LDLKFGGHVGSVYGISTFNVTLHFVQPKVCHFLERGSTFGDSRNGALVCHVPLCDSGTGLLVNLECATGLLANLECATGLLANLECATGLLVTLVILWDLL